MERIGHFLDGRRIPGAGARCGPVFDPATGRQTAEVTFATGAEVEAAVASARRAATGWAAAPPAERAQILFRCRAVLQAHADELARLLTAEHGKTLADARGEVARAIEAFEFACGVPQHLQGEFSTNASQGVDVHSLRAPIGVAVGITPFNFPVMVPSWMLANAIACGNAFVLKPSEKDPSASLRLAELLGEAGLPPGVLNVVAGDREAVDALLDHPDVGAVSFVGSTPVARSVYQRATANGKRAQALGGAKNHMVVLPDADVDAAVGAAMAAAYGAAGERCMAISVLVAPDAVADRVVAAIRARAPSLRVGAGADDGVEMGPLITREHRDRVAAYLDRGVAEGAELVVDGRPGFVERDGFFLGPSLLDRVTPGMSVYADEIFGPVLSVARVAGLDDAIRLVNDHPLGNGTAIFTRDGAAARRFQNEVEIGMVGVNVPVPVPVAWQSFGGWKHSLFGDTHIYGPDGVRFWTRRKVVTSRW